MAERMCGMLDQEASQLGHGEIHSGHILLGLMRAGNGVARKVLKRFPTCTRTIRQRIAELSSGKSRISDRTIINPQAVRYLDAAAAATRTRLHPYIGTEHLLLGILREKNSLASQTMDRIGINPDEVKAKVLKYMGHPHPTVRKLKV
jgi:ATP-dependent Clp protease ATP-binding subunit ClpC